jgi:hypothetical protein
LAFAFIIVSSAVPTSDFVFIVFAYAVFAVIGLRAIFRQVKLAAEAELEYRHLHGEEA